MKAVYFENERAAYFPGLGLEFRPGVNTVGDEQAAAALALPREAGLREATPEELADFEEEQAREEAARAAAKERG